MMFHCFQFGLNSNFSRTRSTDNDGLLALGLLWLPNTVIIAWPKYVNLVVMNTIKRSVYRVAQKLDHFYKVATLVYEKCSGVLAHLYINKKPLYKWFESRCSLQATVSIIVGYRIIHWLTVSLPALIELQRANYQ